MREENGRFGDKEYFLISKVAKKRYNMERKEI